MVKVKALVATANIASSHVQFAGRLADLLVNAGHEAHMFVTVWDPNIDGCGATQPHKVTRYVPTNADEIHALNNRIAFKNDYFSPRKETFSPEQAKLFAHGNYLFFKAIMSAWKILDELRAEQYNVGIADDACSLALFHVLEIPCTIFISPVSVSEFISHPLGLSSPPSYVAELNTAPCSAPHMSFSERATNLYRTLFRTTRILRIFDTTVTKQMRQIVPSIPSFSELLQRTSLVFVNSHYMLDTARPFTHKVKQIGGVAVAEPKKLTNRLKDNVDSATKGVVFMSLGCVLKQKDMPSTFMKAFSNSFTKFTDYHFIWQGESHGSNVFHFDSIDQPSLLAHPKTKLFISHCGQNGLNEAAYFGVPVLAIPFFGDQLYNAAIVQNKRVGICLDKMKIYEEVVTVALRTLLEDDTYRANARLLQRKIHSMPFPPEEVFVKWTEFAAEFGTELNDFNLPSSKMSFAKYYCIDVLAPVFALIALLLYGMVRFIFNGM